MASSRHIVANLDVESHWQHLLLPRRAMPQLGRRVLDLISAYGTLLRAWGSPDDPGRLWTPTPVNPARLTGLLPTPHLVSGAALLPESPDVGWGVVNKPAARVNHRRYAFELSRRLGVELPDSRWATNLEDVLDAVAPVERWVAKAPLSASGRDRVVGAGSPDTARVRRLRNLLRRADGLVVEPWKERVDDFGVLFEVTDSSSEIVSVHRQIVSETGAFAGIDWHAGGLGAAQNIETELRRIAAEVGQTLQRQGYRGPAGLDAWTWRREPSAEGSLALNPLGEINGRLSFGWVARQIGLRLGREQVSLRLGSGRQMAESRRAEPVLLPDTDDRGAAWLEPMDR